MGRTKQRENRRVKAMKEEELDLCNDFGDEDLTPYLAVKNIIRRWKIPSRPVIRPALARDETRTAMASAMKDAIAAAWEGKNPGPDLETAGQAGADGIRAYIDSHISPPNSPATVNGGWIWNRAAKKAVYVKGKGFNKPLFDTGALYDAFGYEVEE